MTRRFACVLVLLGLAAPADALAQSNGVDVELGGLLRAGFRLEPETSGEPDGFDVFDARANASGSVGIVFDYMMQVEYDTEAEVFRLLDARATLPVIPEFEISFGLFRPAFGLEALQTKGDLTFLERSQASTALAPGRQVGISVDGEALDGRLTWGGGVFNGNGSTLRNDGDDFMVAGRVQFNSIGTIAFYEDFVIQVGGSIARSTDTAAPLGRGIVTGDPLSAPEYVAFAGDRTLLGADVQASYRGFTLTGELLAGDFELEDGTGSDAHGGYVELGYRAYGAIEGVARYDAFEPAAGDSRKFMVFGLNVYPGHFAKFGLQYAVDVNDSPDAPTIAGNQFIFLAQVDF